MRAELPWNVAGIPPEVREAARAAARREGLSVGEWLTRQILQSFSGLEGDGSRPPAEPSDPDDLTRDASPSNSGGISFRPQPGEPESEETWRRIEEQLRGIG